MGRKPLGMVISKFERGTMNTVNRSWRHWALGVFYFVGDAAADTLELKDAGF